MPPQQLLSFPLEYSDIYAAVIELGTSLELPERLDLVGVRCADCRLGWPMQDAQFKRMVDWAMENTGRVTNNDGTINVRATGYNVGAAFADSLGIIGGVTAVYVPSQKKPNLLTTLALFWIETNGTIIEDRYNKVQHEEFAEKLGFEGPPKWYISADFIDQHYL
ncbi:hypothetical protein MIND_01105000 [Mycena indigotica]|uniref:Uncharacterized protein n=1 Tax=Mycena indigotica TaxID=2126181 RepID=A0A8H6SA38_9AGAR|nr:uncharacterized protein MIND_01105000 [Mycena indigotica]KAF7295648.1 hypothetical protein MIND_01105000 [Mycena indigotica]